MNEQKGALKLRGTHGDFTFAQTADGFIWKQKNKSITLDAIMKDPKKIKLKHIVQEFGRAGNAVKFFRTVFQNELEYAKDRRLTSRLQKCMMELIKSDPVNKRGERKVSAGNFHSLENVEMNAEAALFRSFPVEIQTTYDRTSGQVSIPVPSFISAQILKRAPNVTHYKFIAAAAELDFDNAADIKRSAESAFLPLEDTASTAFSLDLALTPASDKPVVILLGILYAELINGYTYPEINGEFNALCIVKTDMP